MMVLFTKLSLGCIRRAAVLAVFVGMSICLFDQQPVLAQGGDLAVSPTRVVFEGRKRSAQLSLVNRGSTTSTYRIRIVNMQMTEDGQMKQIDKAEGGAKFASKLFRYSPRQVTLGPGEAQAVRLLLRKPGNLGEGEYRSHLMMQTVPKDAGISIEQEGAQQGVQIRMVPVFGITIPVIVRHGQTQADVTLTDLKVMPPDANSEVPRLQFTINRAGSSSAFGDLTATLDAGGTKTVIGQVMRLAVYTPNDKRKVSMALRLPSGTSLSGGKIDLSFNKTEDDGGQMIANAGLNLP